MLDCLIAQLLYRLIDDGISPIDDWTIQLQDGTSNNMIVGLTFAVCLSPDPSTTLNTHIPRPRL
jgi:hypothetical protein